ncbi:MAG: hypothetical protein K2H19_10150 [Ruminococcus sp.]|nr:hypothetical protein [Ruminococcus sp.]
MKKLILSAMVALIAVTGVFSMSNDASVTSNAVTTSQTMSISDISQEVFSIQNLRNLQNFLLIRPTEEDLNGKNYDLDGDGVCSVLDLCLMRRLIQIPEKNSDFLVAYFSRTGTTEVIADYIIDITGADFFEIEAAVPYTDEDIQYSNSSCRVNQKQELWTVLNSIIQFLSAIRSGGVRSLALLTYF